MYNTNPDTPIKEVTFGEGMKTSLNNYYDILKEQAGGLGAQEFLQLKLAADGIDISEIVTEGSYKFFSYYNLLRRSDLAIEPKPVSGTVMTGAVQLHDVYGKFLSRLRSLIVLKDLSAEDELKISEYDLEIERNEKLSKELYKLDQRDWKDYCELRGVNQGDIFLYIQWSSLNGQIRKIEEVQNKNNATIIKRKQIFEKYIPNPDDKEIIDAEIEFNNPFMRLCYPTLPDYEYGAGKITLEYLAQLPHVSSGLFDDRRVISWDKTLNFIKTANQGILNAKFSRETSESKSIETDWNSSGSARYGFFIRVKANVSEHTQIQEDFKKATEIKLDAKATLRVNINFGSWFKPNLFEHTRVKENPQMFTEFFGENGSLLYYPTALILIRGFGISFKTSSAWTYDYDRKFSASGGGGFGAFGINFGGKSSYSQHQTEHKIDKTGTELSITDDEKTLRFVGYVVKKNEFFKELNLNAVSSYVVEENEPLKKLNLNAVSILEIP
jgi:hypothetical protein